MSSLANAQWDWGVGRIRDSAATVAYAYSQRLTSVGWCPDSTQRKELLKIFDENDFLCFDCEGTIDLQYLFVGGKPNAALTNDDRLPQEAKTYLWKIMDTISSYTFSRSAMSAHLPQSDGDSDIERDMFDEGMDSFLVTFYLSQKPWKLFPEEYKVANGVVFFTEDYETQWLPDLFNSLKKRRLYWETIPPITLDFIVQLKPDGHIKVVENLCGPDYKFMVRKIERDLYFNLAVIMDGDQQYFASPEDSFNWGMKFILSVPMADVSYARPGPGSVVYSKKFSAVPEVKLELATLKRYANATGGYEEIALKFSRTIIMRLPEVAEVQLNDSITLKLHVVRVKIKGRTRYWYELTESNDFATGNRFTMQPFINAPIRGTVCEFYYNEAYYEISGRLMLEKPKSYILGK